jgi:hypothetical protein
VVIEGKFQEQSIYCFRLKSLKKLDRVNYKPQTKFGDLLFLHRFLLLLLQMWTQKCAVQKASVDVNIGQTLSHNVVSSTPRLSGCGY